MDLAFGAPGRSPPPLNTPLLIRMRHIITYATRTSVRDECKMCDVWRRAVNNRRDSRAENVAAIRRARAVGRVVVGGRGEEGERFPCFVRRRHARRWPPPNVPWRRTSRRRRRCARYSGLPRKRGKFSTAFVQKTILHLPSSYGRIRKMYLIGRRADTRGAHLPWCSGGLAPAVRNRLSASLLRRRQWSADTFLKKSSPFLWPTTALRARPCARIYTSDITRAARA